MKRKNRTAAFEEMAKLLDLAVNSTDGTLAKKYAAMAWRISTKYRIRMPYVMRFMFCKRCKSFMRPGIDCRFRLGGNHPHAMRITCMYCGHIYRKVLKVHTQPPTPHGHGTTKFSQTSRPKTKRG